MQFVTARLIQQTCRDVFVYRRRLTVLPAIGSCIGVVAYTQSCREQLCERVCQELQYRRQRRIQGAYPPFTGFEHL
jgi:hypothetical protein